MLVIILTLLTIGQAIEYGNDASNPDAALVLLAATTPDDAYYKQYFDDVTAWQISYAKLIAANGDNVIVLCREDVCPEFLKELKPDQTALTLGNTYQPPELSKDIQSAFQEAIKQYCPDVQYTKSEVKGDGGNIVDNFVDTAIAEDRIFIDNPNLTPDQIREKLLADLDYKTLVYIPDTKDKLGHADGVVSFIDDYQLAVTGTLKEEIYWEPTMKALKTDVPQLAETLIVLNSSYQEQKFDAFDSACGLHINSMLTKQNLYVPVFGEDPENQDFGQSTNLDNSVLSQIKAGTKRNVVSVPVPNIVCRMGGSVRCLSAPVQGPLADCLIKAAQDQVENGSTIDEENEVIVIEVNDELNDDVIWLRT